MKIGIDISQLAYEKTGVAEYLGNLVTNLLAIDKVNSYVLFFSSLRRSLPLKFLAKIQNPRVEVKMFKFPPTLLDFIWNRIHVFPIENLIGAVDVFITSDRTEPPSIKAKKVAILYDLIVYQYPEETAAKIVATQKRKWVFAKSECQAIFAISKATIEDGQKILEIKKNKLFLIYPGI